MLSYLFNSHDPQLTTLIQRLSAEFTKRWEEEQQETCKTPVVHMTCPIPFSKRIPELLPIFRPIDLLGLFAVRSLLF